VSTDTTGRSVWPGTFWTSINGGKYGREPSLSMLQITDNLSDSNFSFSCSLKMKERTKYITAPKTINVKAEVTK
jgi:hypothetical protein